MKKTIILILLFLILHGCGILDSHNVDLEHYLGTWLFIESEGGTKYIDNGTLTFYPDSTFESNFSYFFTKDTLNGNDSLKGKWYPWLSASDPDKYYVQLYITVDSIKKSWRISGTSSDGDMTWFKDFDGFNKLYKWNFIE